MTVEELLTRAQALVEEIKDAREDDRYELHQQLHRALTNIEQLGGRVPAQLKRLDFEMLEEEIEDSFDNMPV